MATADSDQVEVNSPATANNNTASGNSNENGGGGSLPLQSLGRQSSIYSLTLDEFQNTMCEGGKNFGSMNMDEFLNSIWTAEENQNQVNNNQHHHHAAQAQHEAVTTLAQSMGIMNPQQGGLARQGSLSLPAPLCRKTVEEVWSEIQRGGGRGGGGAAGAATSRSGQNQSTSGGASAGPVQQRQQTFGEMTLEDFLIKAGVVRDAGLAAPPAAAAAVLQQQQQQPPQTAPYGMFQNGSSPYPGPVMTVPPAAAGGGGDPSAYITGGGGMSKRNSGYAPVGPACYGGNGGGGYLGMTSPVSPLGPEMDVRGGRKRTLDGPVEKVVERRQRRMIKNRESAARSRARKQAYTVELEAELNQLREENSQLKHALGELERQRNQQYVEEQQNVGPQCRAHKVQDKQRLTQRSKSCPL